jgi:phytoene desaturase
MSTPRSALIIGAGFGGLGLAAMLAKTGWKVTVCEKNEQLGGRASVLRENGFTFDMGPSWYLMPEIFAHFFELLGSSAEKALDLRRLDPSYRVFFKDEGGLRVDLHADMARDAATIDALEPGASAKLVEYLARSKEQYEIATSRFIYKNADHLTDFVSLQTAREARKLSVITPMQRYVGKWFKDERLRKLLMYHLVFLGSSPKLTPALYSLMSHIDWNQGVFYPMGGIGKVVDAIAELARANGAELRTSAPAKRIVVEDGQARGIELESGETLRADVVISNADYHFTETRLLAPEQRAHSQAWWNRRTLAPSAHIMYLGVRGKLPSLTHHNLLFAKDWDTHFEQIFDAPQWPDDPSYYVCMPSATDPSVAPPDHENLFVLVPIAAGLEYTPEELDKRGDALLEKLEREMGCEGLRERVVSKRHFCVKNFRERYNSQGGSALGLAHTLLQTSVFRPGNVSRKVKGLYYVGAGTVPGIGMPMCLVSAELAYKRIMGLGGDGPLERLAAQE